MAGRKRTPDGKRTRELLRQLPSGFALEQRGGGHLAVMCPDGSELRDEKGTPVRVASTSNEDTIRYDLARIRRALHRQDFAAQARVTSTGDLGRLLRQLPHQAIEQRAAIRAELRRRS